MVTIDKLREYQIFTQRLKKTMLLSGLLPTTEPNLFYRILPCVILLINLMATFVVFNFCLTYQSDLELMTKGMGILITMTATDLKISCVVLNWRGVAELHKTLDHISHEVLRDKINQRRFLKKFTTVHRLSTILIVMALLAIGSIIVRPTIPFMIQLIRHNGPINYELPLPSVYPWRISDGSFLYYCHLVLETLCGYFVFLVACAVDASFPIYIFQMAGQFDAMSYKLNNLKDGDNYDAIIQQCVTKHQMLLRCRDIIETIYGPIIIWMLLTTAIVLCALTFQISKLETFVVARVCSDVAYMFSKLLQIFIYASSGTILTSASETYADAVYVRHWPATGRKRFMSSILIMLAQKPLVITACRYSIVSINLFAEILSTTVSYFLLLKTMDDKST